MKEGYDKYDGSKDHGYYKLDGKPLGEKNPKWLLDDYVKFIRLSQWKIDSTSEGVVGLITNHNYLSNLTFRGMRQSLLMTFNAISVLDLHADVRNKETPPNAIKDENVFEGIQEGVSISLFVKSVNKSASQSRVFYSELWGSREGKVCIFRA